MRRRRRRPLGLAGDQHDARPLSDDDNRFAPFVVCLRFEATEVVHFAME
jgi:hypothetical protein